MAKTTVKAVLIASISASLALLMSQDTPPLQSAITVPMTSWLLYQFSSSKKAWHSLSAFKNPILFSINSFFVSFTYASWQSIPFWNSIYLSIGVFMLGSATSLLISKYWNMGG